MTEQNIGKTIDEHIDSMRENIVSINKKIKLLEAIKAKYPDVRISKNSYYSQSIFNKINKFSLNRSDQIYFAGYLVDQIDGFTIKIHTIPTTIKLTDNSSTYTYPFEHPYESVMKLLDYRLILDLYNVQKSLIKEVDMKILKLTESIKFDFVPEYFKQLLIFK